MKVGRLETTTTHAVLVVMSVIALYPLVTILASSLSSSDPGHSWLTAYVTAWTQGNFASALLSSAIVATTVVVVTVIVACLAGYALATMLIPLAGLISAALLVGIVLPYEVTVLPLYELLSGWGLVGTYWGLILPQIGLSVPLGVFWMRSFFASIPTELLEAARIDGASRFQTLRLVMLPVAVPAIATLTTILFLFTWNEFLLALILVPDNSSVQTAPLSLSFFAGNERSSDPSVTAAAAVLVALPIVIAYVVLQRRLITGIVDGAVK